MSRSLVYCLAVFFFLSCSEPKADNACDLEDSNFLPNIFYRLAIKDKSDQCGYRVSPKTPACLLSYEETHLEENWPQVKAEMETQFALGSGDNETLVQYRSETVSSVIGSAYPAFQGALNAPNGNVYFAPYYSPKVLAIDPITKDFSTTGNFSGSVTFIGASLGPGGIIYYAPHQIYDFFALDTSQNLISIVGNDSTMTGTAYNGAIYAPNGKIYFVPSSENIIRYYDTNSKTIGSVSTPTTGGFSNAVLTPQGKIYFIPFTATTMYILNTKDDSVSTHPYSFPSGSKYISGILTPNGRIYMIPFDQPNQIIYLDTNTQQIETVASIPSAINSMFNGAVLAPNGKIYLVPENYPNFISFDTSDHSFKTLFPKPTGSYRGGALGPDGDIYLASHTVDRFDLIHTNSNGKFCDSLRLSPYWNKL
ncbi:hypothetical protein [Leptospira brenneri]|uniref:Lipoprotein n=1 Tax=Leptospira brenneri TaxID=2023182 RepID=A0A2M9Y247_9LEPT|nr:hypothetical protein [Leptospira brenneri]PJZ45660.1 hypothetical protein CH361_11005 [Leptospira brenneri]TGK92035.1 hypothetical protein EHQ30_17810 [Leptospira brenneri]